MQIFPNHDHRRLMRFGSNEILHSLAYALLQCVALKVFYTRFIILIQRSGASPFLRS